MSKVIVESVPNFSEGRRPEVIKAIAKAFSDTLEVKLLHIDIGEDANRTVFSLAGPPQAVCEALFDAAQVAANYIDMKLHLGNHPRMGMLDVCPLIPISGISISELDVYAKKLGQRLGDELDMPVFYYEKSALSPHKNNLANIRSGEYEGLKNKMTQATWRADNHSPYNAKTGATALGVRNFLLAYNVNLETKDVMLAKKIALNIREKGYIDDKGNHCPGLLTGVKAIGWYMEEYGCAQVSTNIVDIHACDIATVFLTVKKLAAKESIEVNSAELIGLIPMEALRLAASKLTSESITDEQAIELVEEKLGLDLKEPFDLKARTIEYLLA